MSNEATLHTVNGEPTLRFERRLRHTPAKVWRVVSDPAEMAHWFPTTVEAELRPGAPMRFIFPEEAIVDGVWDGEVLEVDPPKVFMFRWNQDVLRFELIPDGDGCRLVFTQTLGFGGIEAGRTAAGWDQCLDQLAGRLDGQPVADRTDWLTPIEDYIEKFGLGEGTVERVDGGYELHFARDLVWKPAEEVWALLVKDYVPANTATKTDPPRELSYEWSHVGAPAGTVRWTIVSDTRRGVRAEVTQTVPERLADLLPATLATWHVRVEQFFAALHGAPRPWPDDRVTVLTKHYAAATA